MPSNLEKRVAALEVAAGVGAEETLIVFGLHGHEPPEECKAAIIEQARREQPSGAWLTIWLFDREHRCRHCGDPHLVDPDTQARADVTIGGIDLGDI